MYVCAQSCQTLCNPTDCSQPGSSVHAISQAGKLEQVAIPHSRGSSWPRNQTHVSYVSWVGRRILALWATKTLSAIQETQVQALGQEEPLDKGMVTHSSVLAWKIPWTEEPSRLQSMGLQRVRHNWAANTVTWLILVNRLWGDMRSIIFSRSYLKLWKPCVEMLHKMKGISVNWVQHGGIQRITWSHHTQREWKANLYGVKLLKYGWMASLTQWTWVWVDSGSWWWTGRPGVLQFMGSQRVGHDWTKLNWTELVSHPSTNQAWPCLASRGLLVSTAFIGFYKHLTNIRTYNL